MKRFLHDHSLTIVFVGIYFACQTLAALFASDPFSEDWLKDMFQGHADDTFGALLIVFFTKFFHERGSAESKK